MRVGSGWNGLDTLDQVTPLIPEAHRRGIKVIAWYFPYFRPVLDDVRMSLQAIRTTVGGEGFDGFAADIEPTPGSKLNAANASAYSTALRETVPGAYLIAVPPRPTPTMIRKFPYAAVVPHYDAVAPMVYWGRYSPRDTVARSIGYLKRFGVPIAPIGQAYDMGPEGGPNGNPTKAATLAFIWESRSLGSIGVSFWDWQSASREQWDAIRLYRW